MAKAEQLPSGSWRIRVYDKDTKKRVSFTSTQPGKAGKNEVELMAREYLAGLKQKKEKGKTVGECIDEYIESKGNILAPATIYNYKNLKKYYLIGLCDCYVSEITSTTIQSYINQLALSKTASTVRSAHQLLTAVLDIYAPDLRIKTTLPKSKPKEKVLPDAKDVLKVIMGTNIELPCLIAMWCTLRASEVCALKKSDIKGRTILVHDTLVTIGNDNILQHKTKTEKSTRYVRLPQRILDLIDELPPEQDYLTTLSRKKLYNRFVYLLEKNNMPHMSFHELRHLSASIMHLLNIPEKYAMERGGWSSPTVMKDVYLHTFSKEREMVDDKIDKFFEDIIDSLE